MLAAVGVIGLGVMGKNLALNMERNGFAVASCDRNAAQREKFAAEIAGKNLRVYETVASFMAALATPRRVLIMVPAGKPVEAVLADLMPLLTPGDVVMDGGNTYFTDTDRRAHMLAASGAHYLGVGISGGEQGALWGAAIMPGGDVAGWEHARPVLQAIAARYQDEPCVAYMGQGGAGHYVKMMHNGIEYADMQLLAETYDVLQRGAGLTPTTIADLLDEWNAAELQSYLVEITAHILRRADPETGAPLITRIVDEAEQKGTGKWATQNAIDIGAPAPTMHAAVETRLLSSLKAERVAASQLLAVNLPTFQGNVAALIHAARQALFASKLLAYAQGFGVLHRASAEYGYALNLLEIARVWRAGCIIRAKLLNEICAAFARTPTLPNLLMDEPYRALVLSRQAALREVVQTAAGLGIPLLAHACALGYFDAYRCAVLPANLTQAQRDYFGAHTYRRVDKDGVFHTRWEE